MPSLFSAAQLVTLRREWLGDYVNDRVEWGGAPVLASGASAGASSLALSGCVAAATLTAGTRFDLVTGGGVNAYNVTADATVTGGGTATIAIAPGLRVAAVAGDRVRPFAILRSPFNVRTHTQYHDDATLGNLAQRAMERWGAQIADSADRTTMHYRAVRILAYREMLADGQWVATLKADDPSNRMDAVMDGMRKQLAEDELFLSQPGEAIPFNVSLLR